MKTYVLRLSFDKKYLKKIKTMQQAILPQGPTKVLGLCIEYESIIADSNNELAFYFTTPGICYVDELDDVSEAVDKIVAFVCGYLLGAGVDINAFGHTLKFFFSEDN